ncbi:MAG TPA: TldD/PmbA family protein [Candidatus Cloacimonadota bacterium]|nr:TldD/PmbA family protein [Candidatus Cloacimonadota bacterium]HPS39595.1 TldD/PmbA family protein [Candidatus Cloacimonadota bacterium]
MKKMQLAKILLPGGAYYELKQQENRSQSLAFLNGTLVSNGKSANGGIMSRTFLNGVWGLASSADMSLPGMEKVMKKALANAELLSAKVNKGKIVLPCNPARGEYLFFTRKQPWTTAAKIEYLKVLDNYVATKYPDLSTRQVAINQDEMEKYILTSDGGEVHSMTPRTILVVVMMATHNGEPLQHYGVFGGFGQFEDNFEDPQDLFADIDKLYKELMDKKEAVFAKGGTFECVLDAKLAGILSHEAIGHTTEADFVINGSIAGEYLDKPIANEIVTLIDIANTWDDKICPVPVFIDDEGTLAEDCVIIKDGYLRRYMHDKESAQILGQSLTGNARGYAYSDEPLIRMRNTMIVPGNDKLKDMIASIEDGYYLINPSNGQADATSEFMFGVSLGYEIKNGVLGKAIKETTISGVAFDLLKTVTMISDEMNWTAAGMCGKKQMIPVGMGGPAIKCKVNMGGKA